MQAASDPAYRPHFYKELVQSKLFVIQEGIPLNEGQTTVEKGYQVQIRSVEFNGKSYLPVFSSLPRLQTFLRSEAQYLAMNALDFMKLTQGAGFLLNPGSDYGKEFTKEEVESILQGTLWQPSERFEFEKPTEVQIGHPAIYPKELVEALCRYFKTTKEVKRAYVAQILNPERDPSRTRSLELKWMEMWNPSWLGPEWSPGMCRLRILPSISYG